MFRFQTKDFDRVWVAVTKQLDQLSEGINGRIGFYMADLLKISSGQDFAFAVYGTAAHIQIRVFCVCAVCIRAAQAEQNDILSHMRIDSQKIVCGGLQLLFHFLYFHRVFLFDVMEKETGKYLPQDQVKEMVTELGLTYVPVFYDGPFVSWKAISTTNRVRERMKNQKQICVRKNIKIAYPGVHKSKTIKKC